MLHDGNIALKYFELKIFHGGNKINSSFIHAFTQEIAIECLPTASTVLDAFQCSREQNKESLLEGL